MTPLSELEAIRAAAPPLPGHTLPIGTRLREYEIKGLIGEGTCSIVYSAWDHALQRKVAVKEYMPAALVGRIQGAASVVVASERHLEPVRAGLRGFVNEARLLARFDHPSLVKVYRFWEENGTAYMVMPHYEGPTLKTALAELGHVPSEAELRTWLKPILNAVTLLHDSNTFHQNIGPDEIVLTPFGPVLLGFAAAAHAIEALHHTPAAALKAGFAAIEQYGSEAGTTRGAWTDLYALAAVVYSAITGDDPAPAADRLAHDRLRPLSVIAAGLYSERFLAAIDAAMAVQPRQRPADHREFRALMGDIEAPEAVTLALRPDLMQELFTGAPARSREVTVPDPPPPAASEAEAAAPVVAAEPTPARGAAEPAPALSLNGGAEPAVPSWMKAASAHAFGKRALYGVIAGTCVLIGVAALVAQFAGRSAGRAPQAAASATARAVPAVAPSLAAASTPAAPSRRTSAATTATATATKAAAPATPAATAKPAAPAATTAPIAAAIATRESATPPAPAKPAPAAATTTLDARSPAPSPPPPSLPPGSKSPAVALAPAATAAPLDRQARCTEILQKASLEKIAPAETDFFKRECK
jgi:serine/threonine protein kinase